MSNHAKEIEMSSGLKGRGGKPEDENKSDKSKSTSQEDEELFEFPWLGEVEKHPCRSLCIAWLAFLVVLILILIASASGVTVIRFSTDVPMYLRDHESYRAQSALIQAKDQANAPLLEDGNSVREREEQEWSLEIIYESDGRSTMLSPEVLSAIVEFENRIINTENYAMTRELIASSIPRANLRFF
ncbi:MAG: hypothetical protein AAGM67_05760 [Bacteroidota bacterium]